MLRLRISIACALGLLATAPCLRGQAQTLFSETFESGSTLFTFDNDVGVGSGLWHFAGPVGTCAAITNMVVYNNAVACNYATAGTGNEGALYSPPVLLAGQSPFWLSFNYVRKLDPAGGDSTCVAISDAGDGNWTDLACSGFGNSGGLDAMQIPIDGTWSGHLVQFRFQLTANATNNGTYGWAIDNVFVQNSGGWIDLGHAHAGQAGLPKLAGTGTLGSLPPNTLKLTKARPSSPAALFFGLSQIDAPFKGGVLVPSPLVTIALATDAAGSVTLPIALPVGTPHGLALYFQCWIQDAAASKGFAASNGLAGITQ